jgi:hypothetical protein
MNQPLKSFFQPLILQQNKIGRRCGKLDEWSTLFQIAINQEFFENTVFNDNACQGD